MAMEASNTVILDGRKLRQLREEQKLTQLYLATAVEVTTETISRWENKAAPSIKLENAQRLAEALQVPLSALLPAGDTASSESPGQNKALYHSARPLVTLVKAACLFLVGVLVLFWFFWHDSDSTNAQAERYLPAHSLPGQPFPVLLHIHGDGLSHSLMLREELPPGLTLISATPAAVNGGQTAQQVKWISPAGEHRQKRFVYLAASAPESMGRQYHFTGTLVSGDRDSRPATIQGAASITIKNCHWADTNCDHIIDDYEMLSVFDLFPRAGEYGLDVAAIQAIWAGQGYIWHEARGSLEILDRKAQPQHKPQHKAGPAR